VRCAACVLVGALAATGCGGGGASKTGPPPPSAPTRVAVAPKPTRTTRLLGYSTQGRPIRVTELVGRRPGRTILVIGCIHGTEPAGIAVTKRLLAGPAPRAGTIWILQDLNPDGRALGTRGNARGVDLNRNFPSQWRRIGQPGDPQFAGPQPLSEPESRVAARAVLRIRPDITIWFHQPQTIVRAYGQSEPTARRYAHLVGMVYRRIHWPSGSAPNWQNHRFPGRPAFVVELPPGPLSSSSARRQAQAIRRLAPAPATIAPAAASSSHVAVIVMENKESSDVLRSSSSRYVAALARRYAIATSSYAIGHPSLPNYLALTSGSTHGITSDCTDCHVAARNIVDQLAAARLSWRAYMEGLPSPCSQVAGADGYAKKHDPFLYYDDIARDPRRCRNVVGFDQLASDLRRGRLPTFAFISSNLCHDTHDCDIATGDRFLAGLVPTLLRELGPRGFLVLTWDEGSTGDGCCTDAHGGRIATIVAGHDVRRHALSSRPVDHYGVLHTIEDALGLAPLGGAARRRSGTLATLFAHAPHVR
jgi:hypothetical protein